MRTIKSDSTERPPYLFAHHVCRDAACRSGLSATADSHCHKNSQKSVTVLKHLRKKSFRLFSWNHYVRKIDSSNDEMGL